MATVEPFIEAQGETATLKTRSQGARDAVTQWPAVTYSDSTISIMINESGTSEQEINGERVSVQTLRGYVGNSVTITDRDRIVYHGETYEVEGVGNTEYLLGDASYTEVNLVRLTT